MSQFSHSRVECYHQCPYKFKLRYIDEILLLENYEPSNALTIGTAMHLGIETDIKNAIDWYYKQFPIITDNQINEVMKLEYVISLMKNELPKGGLFEVEINDVDFKGFIDYLIEIEPNVYDIYDFKYSNNINRYLESDQLHLYKYYFEKTNPNKRIRNLYFMFGPKVQIKQKENEDIQIFRRRFMNELNEKNVIVQAVEYDSNKVIEYLTKVKKNLEATDYPKEPSKLCYFCEYRAICETSKFYEIKESEEMNLPSTERRTIKKDVYKKIWIYGAPFSGKTTFVDKAPNPLNLNTDGNIKYVTMPVIPIRDEVRTEGRQTIVTKAWDQFKDTIVELSKKENDFKTIVVDLLEDTFEYCRLYMYEKLNITHESDSGFGKGYDMITTEFLSTIKKLLNLDYNIVLISHEDASKDLTKKTGDKITAIKPNIKEKIANKIAGMVDIVGRVVADDNSRTLEFKSDEVVFGGGRLTLTKTSISLDWDELMKIYEAQKGEIIYEKDPIAGEVDIQKVDEVEPTKRTRKPRGEKEDGEPQPIEPPSADDEEEKPKRRRRKSEE